MTLRPSDHAPDKGKFPVGEMSFAQGKVTASLYREECARLDRLEVDTLAMRGTTEDLYDGDEPARAREIARLRSRQQVLLLYAETLEETMDEASHEFVPSAEERADMRAEDERGEAA